MDAKNIIDIIEKFKPESCWEDIGVTADIFKFVRGIITKSIFDDLGFLEAETIVNQPMQFKWK